MADLTITAANVGAVTGYRSVPVIYGAAVAHGEPVYKKSSDSKYYPADAATNPEAIGIALTPGFAADDVGIILTAGPLYLGAILTAGEHYVVSATAGKIAPRGDLIATNTLTSLGIALSTTVLDVQINQTGVVL